MVLQMNHIMKIYGNGVVANEDVSLELRKGEIHALLGENGAGKSTLMKVLFGIESPDQGEIILNGNKTSIKSPQDAISKGIGMVHQHFMLVPSLSVAENIILGVAPKKGIFIDMDKAVKAAQDIAKEYNFDINVKEKVEEIPVGIKQKVEILKALYRGAEILILDEPTAMLDPNGRREVIATLHELNRQEKITVLLITHYMEEVIDADRVIVMDDGKLVMDGTPREIFSRVKELKEYRLDVPQVTELAYELKQAGVDLPDGILTMDELMEKLLPILHEKFPEVK